MVSVQATVVESQVLPHAVGVSASVVAPEVAGPSRCAGESVEKASDKAIRAERAAATKPMAEERGADGMTSVEPLGQQVVPHGKGPWSRLQRASPRSLLLANLDLVPPRLSVRAWKRPWIGC